MIAIGRAYEALDKPGLAIHYLESGLRASEAAGGSADVEVLAFEEFRDSWRALGYLYFDNARYAEAAAAWKTAIDLQADPETQARLARAYRLAGELDLHAETIAGVPPDALTGEARVVYLEESVHRFEGLGQPEKAIEHLKRAQQLDAKAFRDFQIGGLYDDIERADQAVHHLLKAVSADPGNTIYSTKLAYAYVEQGRDSEAIPLLEGAVAIEPDHLDVPENLAYAHLRETQNESAVHAFRRAIDDGPAHPISSEADQLELSEEIHSMRREISSIRNRFDFTLYANQSSDSLALGSLPPAPGLGPRPSQGGLEFAYQPPGIGYRDSKTFQIFSRLLWNLETPGFTHIDERFYQLGVGFRYKPIGVCTLLPRPQPEIGFLARWGDGVSGGVWSAPKK